ncbi:MAG TPA: hypothetical protein EYH05_13325 [Anaerolineae bacterium]|nr:hypothetical protein [Anaerolineae bacterium]
MNGTSPKPDALGATNGRSPTNPSPIHRVPPRSPAIDRRAIDRRTIVRRAAFAGRSFAKQQTAVTARS